MNNPEYIIVDEFGLIADAVKVALALPVLNYQYGGALELNQTLLQWAKTEVDREKKFPLIFVEQPFDVLKNTEGNAFWGTIELVRMYIINETDKNWKAKDRMTNNFKPVIYPIYREVMNQIDLSLAFHTQAKDQIEHVFTDRYFWGEAQQSILNDAIDCSVVTIRSLQIANNPNCFNFTNL